MTEEHFRLLIIEQLIYQHDRVKNLAFVMGEFGMRLAPIVIVGVLYAHLNCKPTFVRVDEGVTTESLDGDFRHGFCSCLETPLLCCFSCCCLPLRWGDTVKMVGMLGFWVAVLIFFSLDFIVNMIAEEFGHIHWTITMIIIPLPITLLGTVYRQQLRVAFNMDQKPITVAVDLIQWCCCPCCAIIQEARHVEDARILGHLAVTEPGKSADAAAQPASQPQPEGQAESQLDTAGQPDS